MNTEREVYADANSAILRLRNNSMLVDSESKVVQFSNKRLPGLKLWGAIDYLQNQVKGWTWRKVS